MEEDSREDDFNGKIRRSLCEWLGPFEEFHDRVAKNQQTSRHGLIRSKMKPRPSPFVTLQAPPHESPSHVPVHVALQSMKNLVDERITEITHHEFADLKKGMNNVKSSATSSTDKKRKIGEDEDSQIEVKRKKESRNYIPPSTPDSGTHSTESDMIEEPNSDEVAAMLSIMKTLDTPKLSPLPKDFKVVCKEDEQPGPSSSKFPSDSSVSAASTSRESTPEPKLLGTLRIKALKPERVQKLIELAKTRGKLTDVVEVEKKVVEKVVEKQEKRVLEPLPPPPRPPSVPAVPAVPTPSRDPILGPGSGSARNSPLPPQKPANKTVQSLQGLQGSSRTMSPSPRNIRSTTPSVPSRPPSALSTHSHVETEVAAVATTSAPAEASAAVKPRFVCQWSHARLKKAQRVPFPDPSSTSTKTKGEFYHALAKDWKSKADNSKDRVTRPLNYMLSSVFFVLEAIWKADKERTTQSKMQCASIYRDTYELLGVAVFQGVRDTDDSLAVHILPRVKVIGQVMLAVMQYQMYIFRSEQAIKTMSRLDMREVSESIDIRPVSRASDSSSVHSQHLTVPTNKAVTSVAHGTPKPSPSAGSTPSGPTGAPVIPWIASIQACQNMVSMPQIVYDAYKSQLKTANGLMLASRYWEDSKTLSNIIDSGTFVKDVESIVGKSISMDMQFADLATFVLTAVGSLKAEYEEEQKQPAKPILAKVKKGLDLAIRTGTFHSDRPPPVHRPSNNTPDGKARRKQ